MSHEELRASLGLSRGALTRYIAGERRPALDVALRIQDALGIPAALWLIPARADD